MKNTNYLIILLIVLSVCSGLLTIQERTYQQRLKMQSQEAKDAVYDVLEGPEGSYYVKEVGSFISHFNKGQWVIDNRRVY